MLLLVAGLSPLGNALILPLEDRFPRADLDDPPPPTGFILLGRRRGSLVGEARGVPALNEAGERMRRGGDAGQPLPRGEDRVFGRRCRHPLQVGTARPRGRRLFTALGIPHDRLILEAKSRDTYENAALLKEEFDPRGEFGPGKRWLLITSAYHMPRAIGAFRQAGFNVEPWPVDYRTRGQRGLERPFDKVSEGLRRVDVASREWVGLSGLLADRTDRRVVSGAAAARRRWLRSLNSGR